MPRRSGAILSDDDPTLDTGSAAVLLGDYEANGLSLLVEND